MRRLAMMLAVLLAPRAVAHAQQAQYDVVIANGRVIDPESRLDATRFVGIRNGKIAAISATPISGKTTFDAKGLVVAPGFIDLHAHGQDDENYRIFALDGVTTALELEVGTGDIPGFLWKSRREGADQLRRVGRTHPRADGGHEGSVDRTPARPDPAATRSRATRRSPT